MRVKEKPSKFYDIAAGIYVFSDKLNFKGFANKRIDMPELIEYLYKKNKKIITYNLDEYWIDIGNAYQLNKANIEFTEIFS